VLAQARALLQNSGPSIALSSPAISFFDPLDPRKDRRPMSIAAQNLEPRPFDPARPSPSQGIEDLLDTMPWLPCTLTLEVPVVRFTIADLLALTNGSVVETACHHTSDVPLRANKVLIGWTEFEVIGDRLAVRITDQA
jgi:flagellar motor switch/type III secretory pathway protein FliN